MKSECAFALCPCGAHCWLCLHVFGHVPLMRTATCNSRPRGFTLSRANSVYSCPFETINTLSVSLWHANDVGRLKHKNRVSCLLTATLTGCYWCTSLLRNDWAGWGRREDLIPRTIRGEGHCSGTEYSRRHGWLAGRLFTQQKVLREMWDLWLMGKGHCAWPSTVLLFWVCLSSLRCLDPYFFLYVQYFTLCFPLFCFLFHNFA